MTDEDAPWRPSRDLSLTPAALCALEDALPLEDVYATASVGADTFAVLAERGAEADETIVVVQVDALDPPAWTELSRHEWWANEEGNASVALGDLIDRRREEMPVHDEPDAVVPTIVIPCRNGIEVLYLTSGGVALATQLFDRPADLVLDPDRWPSFEAAMSWVTMEF